MVMAVEAPQKRCWSRAEGWSTASWNVLQQDRQGEGIFHILEDKMDKKRLAVWDGELYLEFHRGTYTSMAQNKKYKS